MKNLLQWKDGGEEKNYKVVEKEMEKKRNGQSAAFLQNSFQRSQPVYLLGILPSEFDFLCRVHILIKTINWFPLKNSRLPY